jgi:carbon-monoxide dehydrogenase medium subunit
MTTYAMLESDPLVRRRLAVLAEAASLVADVQVRNKGTIGGSLAHADPAADLPAVVLALEAQVLAASSAGRRIIPAEKFFKDTFTTALKASEVLSQIKIPVAPARTGAKYEKFANKASHFAVVGVAAVVTLDRGGNCQKARLGITGAGPVATRATAVERLLQGKPATEENIAAAADSATEGIEFLSDLHGSAEYRAHLTRVYTRRALSGAVARAKSR